MNTHDQVYESIGVGYAAARRPDPRIHQLIVDALGNAQSVLNVGAGAGYYEPSDRRVIAVEPSPAMISQRNTGAGPAVQGVAEALPFGDSAFNVALATFTLHHWTEISLGLREMCRVANDQVVLLFEPKESHKFWLVEYFPECMSLPTEIGAPSVDYVGEHLNVRTGSQEPIGGGPRRIWTLRRGPASLVWLCFRQPTPNEAPRVCGKTWNRGPGMPGSAT